MSQTTGHKELSQELGELTDIEMLWKGKILSICDLILFREEEFPETIMFELADTASQIYITGAIYLPTDNLTAEVIGTHIDTLVSHLTGLYTARAVELAAKEKANGKYQQ